MSEVDHEERRKTITLTEDQMNSIVDRAARQAADLAVEQVIDRVYLMVGRSVVGKVMWMVGALVVGAYFLLKSKGWLE